MFRPGTPRRRYKLPDIKYDTPLEELTGCINRLEALVQKTKTNWEENGGRLHKPGRSFFRKGRSLRSLGSKRDVLGGSQRGDTSSLRGGGDDDTASVVSEAPPLPPSGKDPDAQFIPMTHYDEDEMVELLRRIAELVVMGEKAAAALMSRQEKREEKRKQESADDDGTVENNDEYDDDNEASDADLEPHIALFEHFFERNTLPLMVNIVTGASFSASVEKPSIQPALESSVADIEKQLDASTRSTMRDDISVLTYDSASYSEQLPPVPKRKCKSRMLPAFSIATQALQSVSILIQNVARATSLYFLLSNNLINDLINLPLDLYAVAEQFKAGDTSGNPKKTASSEIQELTTHVITFLKSLALRMNVETLQFFLTYPSEVGSEEGAPVSNSHFSSPANLKKTLDFETPKQGAGRGVWRPVPVQSVKVQFPLYDRALYFCAAHMDSFVRTTAMNICLNTLRLVTVDPTDEDPEEKSIGSSPDADLQNAQALPIRERLAIAQHVCNPARVESLVSPIFTKVARLWGVLEEQIRELDLLNQGKLGEVDGGSRVRSAKMAKAKDTARRKKISDTLASAVANFQDEFLLLEDVFRVGLTSMNEQVIEMMLATFVYPLLMQPLLLYMQRFMSASERNVAVATVDLLSRRTDKVEAVEQPTAERIQEAAPAKTALFALGGVFHFVTNPTLLRLLLTALFHPLAPDSSSETMIRAKPDIACLGKEGKITVRTDGTPSVCEDPIPMEKSPYTFGSLTGQRSSKPSSMDDSSLFHDPSDQACVFILSPALTEVLEGDANDSSLLSKTRPNPYRRAILQCLSSGPVMLHLRQLAVLMFDAMVSQFDAKFVASLVFGVGMKALDDDTPMDELRMDAKRAHSDDRGMGRSSSYRDSRHALLRKTGGYMNEVVSALCLSIANVTTQQRGIYKVGFDAIGSHALIYLARENYTALEFAAKVMDGRRRQASFFISELPSKMEQVAANRSEAEPDEEEDLAEDDEQRKGLRMYQMFYDQVRSDSKFSVASEFLRLKDTVGKSEEDEYSQLVSTTSKYDDLSDLVCGVGRYAQKTKVKDTRATLVGRCSSSVFEFLRIDALSTFLMELAATDSRAIKNEPLTGFAVSRGGVILSTKVSSGTDVPRSIFSPMSEKLVGKVLRPEDDGRDKDPPRQGSVVGLVGRTAVPCVCEVPRSSSHLLSDEAQSVVSEGVTWQSLYLVFLGRFMILAEPERGGTGGNGRVVTACSVAKVEVERDPAALLNTATPARRLLVTHSSLDGHIPGLFLLEDSNAIASLGPFNRLRAVRSSLDVWFEDENAAEQAYRVMQSKFKRARVKRGNRLRERLAQDD